ncbi:hypothetical protein BpHYR1_053732 [Brachionus plicatilis]|uniref:Uncharacterized protein n=1 Tax=Brachionus plicatilis TaxID=10195 RepID=A0A3M7PSS1_BRAPC|nr:hypothetical protein BpHYR1_053732 [Brachionus plicatilis]
MGRHGGGAAPSLFDVPMTLGYFFAYCLSGYRYYFCLFYLNSFEKSGLLTQNYKNFGYFTKESLRKFFFSRRRPDDMRKVPIINFMIFLSSGLEYSYTFVTRPKSDIVYEVDIKYQTLYHLTKCI